MLDGETKNGIKNAIKPLTDEIINTIKSTSQQKIKMFCTKKEKENFCILYREIHAISVRSRDNHRERFIDIVFLMVNGKTEYYEFHKEFTISFNKPKGRPVRKEDYKFWGFQEILEYIDYHAKVMK